MFLIYLFVLTWSVKTCMRIENSYWRQLRKASTNLNHYLMFHCYYMVRSCGDNLNWKNESIPIMRCFNPLKPKFWRKKFISTLIHSNKYIPLRISNELIWYFCRVLISPYSFDYIRIVFIYIYIYRKWYCFLRFLRLTGLRITPSTSTVYRLLGWRHEFIDIILFIGLNWIDLLLFIRLNPRRERAFVEFQSDSVTKHR